MTLTQWLLLAPVPFLGVCVTFMLVGLVSGPTFRDGVAGGFLVVLTWPWLVVVTPTLIAGLWGIARAVTE